MKLISGNLHLRRPARTREGRGDENRSRLKNRSKDLRLPVTVVLAFDPVAAKSLELRSALLASQFASQ
jgi:hypothetical protein